MLITVLKKYGIMPVLTVVILSIMVLASLVTDIYLYFYQGFVDLPGIVIPLIAPLLVLVFPVKIFFETLLCLKDTEIHLRKKNEQLEIALKEVQELSGLLPICASCKKIRDDSGYWNQIENYLSQHSELTFSHSICPDCTKTLYPKYKKKIRK